MHVVPLILLIVALPICSQRGIHVEKSFFASLSPLQIPTLSINCYNYNKKTLYPPGKKTIFFLYPGLKDSLKFLFG